MLVSELLLGSAPYNTKGKVNNSLSSKSFSFNLLVSAGINLRSMELPAYNERKVKENNDCKFSRGDIFKANVESTASLVVEAEVPLISKKGF